MVYVHLQLDLLELQLLLVGLLCLQFRGQGLGFLVDFGLPGVEPFEFGLEAFDAPKVLLDSGLGRVSLLAGLVSLLAWKILSFFHRITNLKINL